MDVSVIRPRELGAPELAAWRCMQESAPRLANPFLSAGYAMAVDAVIDTARVAVLEDGGAPVGFFPYELHGRTVAGAIGGWLSLGQGLVHAPGLELDARELLRACGLGAWQFGTLVDDQPWFEPYAAKQLDSAVIDLSGGFEAYTASLKARGSKVVKQTRYKERKLGREVGEVSFSYDVRDRGALDLVREWKSAQYRAMGRPDRFARPWVAELVERLHHTHEDAFAGSLSMLYAGGRPVAAHFGLRSDHTLVTWFPVYDPAFARYSPGLALHLRMAEEAAASGLQHIDMGPAAGWRYKQELQNHSLTVAEGVVRRRTPAAAAHWARHEPATRAKEVVLGNAALYAMADKTMRGVGRLKAKARRTKRLGLGLVPVLPEWCPEAASALMSM
ncbi:GNAT family N-acetyltransferase [Actinomadura barringtoniae]|uniref:GNAT family N-acetyltransferase n=1 Tax=Actinomadura barringtoniae TaxID=1427535 RepID=A0A939PJV0_9ACTN|nr:GNAT family N-acetyltransferase [Actinomadura barringtoniae]MBO2450514.1 GNAT family N-acetyltransferase [Actinomadura barringtoniae]